jgi:iron complex transport system permease protein
LILILFVFTGIIAKSGLIIALSVFTITPLITFSPFHGYMSYFLLTEQPGTTIFVYAILSAGVYFFSKKLESQYERLAIIFSRASLVLMNFGFWVGSLWGDTVFDFHINEKTFAVFWAIALIGTGVWATRNNKKFVVNSIVIF